MIIGCLLPRFASCAAFGCKWERKKWGIQSFFFVAIVNYTITLGFFFLFKCLWLNPRSGLLSRISQSILPICREASDFCVCHLHLSRCWHSGRVFIFKATHDSGIGHPPPQPGMQQEAIITGHERQGWEVSESVGSVLELQNFFLASFLFCVCLLRSLITIVGGTSISLSSEQRWHWSSRHFCSCLGQHGQELGN